MHTETLHARLAVFQMLSGLADFILMMIPRQRPRGCAHFTDRETEGLSQHQGLCTESHPWAGVRVQICLAPFVLRGLEHS